MKIVYVVGGMLSPTGMGAILSNKINWLAEHTDYELFMILTEKAGHPWCYDINPKVKWVNFDINFDELDPMPFRKKIYHYYFKQKTYKKKFKDFLMSVKPDITISTIRREINFITNIKDGSKKIGEIHFVRDYYRNFHKPYLPLSVNAFISKAWMNSLIKQLKKLERFVVLTEEDSLNWPELSNKIVIPNFISDYHGNAAPLESKNVIAVGRYSPEKGFDLLMDTWKIVLKKHPDWKLNIFGTGDYQYFQNMAISKRISQSFTCHPPTSSIYDEYYKSSIFVLSSRHEGFGLVILEAMSVGLPVVAFACPSGPKALISNNSDGILVENGNIEKLADSICYLIENPNIRKELGANAINKAKEYPKDKIMQKWVTLFESLRNA